MREIYLPSSSSDRDFLTLNHSIKQREEQRLRSAKCPRCGRVTLYMIGSLKGKTLVCKACKKPISLTRL